jgi:RNA polymerase subunit RPABC4/transcription elongation factor Spt4
MTGYCVNCGSEIPDDQNTCSMCYGDPYHGSDGYYLEWLEERDRAEREQNQEKEV